MPKFSVIVPMYNCEKYIEKCIESILKQTYIDFELIIIDDGSYDSSPKICDKYAQKDDRVKVIHKKNEGVSIARQTGTSLAIGEYIVFVDSDDWITEDCLSKFSQQINEYNSDIIFSGCVYSYEKYQVMHPLKCEIGYYCKEKIIKKIYPKLIEDSNGNYFSSNIWAKAIRREIYYENQVKNVYIDIGEDAACIKPCIYNSNSITVMSDCMYYYRQNNESATKSGKVFDWEGPQRIGKHLEKKISMKEFDFQAQVYRNIVHNLFNVCVSRFNGKQDYKVIKEDILMHLKKPYYKVAVHKCKYKISLTAWKNLFAKYALSFRLIRVIYWYSKYKNRF